MPTSVTLISRTTEALSAITRASIIELCIAAHRNADFQNLFVYVPSGGLHFLGYCDERLVAHALVTTRWLQPQGQSVLKTAYIDAVSTAPDVQGRGFGSALMRRLARDIEGSHVVACVETDIPDFYAPLGWELWRGPLSGRSEQGLIPTPDQCGIMILRLPMTPSLNVNQPLSIECQPGRIW